jgi:hypothetical protein
VDAGCFLRRCLLKSKTSVTILALLVFSASSVRAESCLTASDLDEATRAALIGAALRSFDLVA